MKKFLVPLILIFFLLFFSLPGQSRILLPLDSTFEIDNHEEHAGLLWNTEEQITVQKLKLEVDSPGKLLAIMPLTSPPTDTYQNEDVIYQPQENFKARRRGMNLPDYFYEDRPDYSFMDKHKTEIKEFESQDQIKDFVNQFLAEADLDGIQASETDLDNVIEYYQKNFSWFHFSILEITDPELPAVNIDAWRTVSNQLFYPLSTGRNPNRYLTVIMEDPLPDFQTYGWQDFSFYIPPLITPPVTLAEIHPGLLDFYPCRGVHTHYWELTATDTEYQNDLLVGGRSIKDLLKLFKR